MSVLPSDEDQTVIVGSNGTGKTQFAVWLLSTRNWAVKPWVIFDYKGDSLIGKIGAKEIKITDKPPTKPGLYIVRPRPIVDEDATNVFLGRMWDQENIGLYVDEGYMIPKNSAEFRAILTQGRSKKIERIILSQRPVLMDRFVFSEGTYFAIFRLTDKRDRITVKEMVPVNLDKRLAAYYCWWYSVRKHSLNIMAPVPSASDIVKLFRPKNKPVLQRI